MAKKILSDGSEMEQVFNKQFFGLPMMFLTVHRHLKGRQMYHSSMEQFVPPMLERSIRILIIKKGNFLLFILVNLGTIN